MLILILLFRIMYLTVIKVIWHDSIMYIYVRAKKPYFSLTFLIGVTMKNLKLNYFTDPGHGWVCVKLQTLIDLGIYNKISTYSYIKGKSAYLEEDCDLNTLYIACHNLGYKIDLTTKHTNNRSPIRSYATYLPHKCVGHVYARGVA